MNALYDFFLTPQPKDSNKTRYHARLVVRDTITLEDIAETIESRSSLRQSDVIGSFIEFANVFKQELSNGNSIHIPGVGSFRIKAESPEVRSPKEIRAPEVCPVTRKITVFVYSRQEKDITVTCRHRIISEQDILLENF